MVDRGDLDYYFVFLLITHSFNRYLPNCCCVPGTVLEAWEAVMNSTDKDFTLVENRQKTAKRNLEKDKCSADN